MARLGLPARLTGFRYPDISRYSCVFIDRVGWLWGCQGKGYAAVQACRPADPEPGWYAGAPVVPAEADEPGR